MSHRTLPLSLPKGARKRKTTFDIRNHTLLEKVCYQVPLCKSFQQQSCTAFIGLSIRAKMTGGGRLLLSENLADTDPSPCKTPIFDLFSLIAPQP